MRYLIITSALLLVPAYAGCRAHRDNTPNAFTNALGNLKEQMAEDGHEPYLPLINEHALRDAIQTAITHAEKKEQSTYFHDRVKPICQQIADEGVWPDNAEFSIISRPLKAVAARERDCLPAGKAFLLHLDINTPGHEHDGYTLPLVSVTYGR